MRIRVDMNLNELIRAVGGTGIGTRGGGLDERMHRRLNYAVVNAINWSALYVQRDAQRNLAENFQLRTPQSATFLKRQAAVLAPRASVPAGRFYAELQVGDPARLGNRRGSESPLLLPAFERGAQKRPVTPGAKSVAVPITGTARPSIGAPVRPELLIRRLGLKPRFSKPVARNVAKLRRTITTGGDRSRASAVRESRRRLIATLGAGQVWQGRERTYMIPRVGIFQRTGPGKGGTRWLYVFDQDVRLPAKLRFLATAQGRGPGYVQAFLESEVAAILDGRRTQAAPRELR